MLLRWTERKFNFDFPVELFEPILMRLRHAPMRFRAMTLGRSDESLSSQAGGRWSIKENVGHIPILDRTLWTRRLEQFLAGADELVAANMDNNLVTEAGLNYQPVEEIHELLREERSSFMGKLDQLQVADFSRSAWHGRLGKPMRLVDMLYFIAEHDDYHLAHIQNLLESS